MIVIINFFLLLGVDCHIRYWVIMRFKYWFIVVFLAALTGFVTGTIDIAFICAEHFLVQYRIWGFSHLSLQWLVVLIAVLMGGFSFWLTFAIAPEVSGSGIPLVKQILAGGNKAMRWQRVIPIKFFATLQLFSCGMLLGERPTIQVGAYVGKMLSDLNKVRSSNTAHLLIAAGAAGGMAAAFNSPLAATFFMLEEMKMSARVSFVNALMIILVGAVLGMLARCCWLGNFYVIEMPIAPLPYFSSLGWLIALGILLGGAGVLFNGSLLKFLDLFQLFYKRSLWRKVFTGAALALIAVFIADWWPNFTNNEIVFAKSLISAAPLGVAAILMLLLIRYVLFMLFHGSGAPGGIFAPMISLGCIIGLLISNIAGRALMGEGDHRGVLAVLCMSGLFASSVRTPITGALLVMELTHSYALLFPLITVCYVATLTAKCMRGEPIYKALLHRSNML